MTLDDRALLALQGPKAARCRRRPRARRRIAALHGHAATTFEGAQTVTSRARATRARTASRSRVPADSGRSLRERAARRPAVKPIGLGARDSLRLEAGSASTATTSTRRRRRSRRALSWSIGKRRRAEGGFPGAARIAARARRTAPRASASACCSTDARRRARAREIADAGRRDRRHRHVGRLRPDARSRRSPWAMSPPRMRRPARSSTLIVRGKPLPAQRRRLALRPPSLRPLRGSRHDHAPLHQGSRIDPRRRRRRHRRHHRLRAGAAGRRRVRRTAGSRRKSFKQGRAGRGRRKRQGGERRLRAGLRRGRRGQQRLEGAPALVNEDADRQGLVRQDEARRPGRTRRAHGRGRLRRLPQELD